MGRKILCEACGSVLNEDILKAKNSMNTCLVCGASLDDGSDGFQTVPEEELITWYYYDFKDGSGAGSLRDKPIDLDKFGDTYSLAYTFQAPPRDKNGKSDAAKDVLRREYKPDAFKSTQSVNNNEPRCPRCGSTSIQLIQRKFSILTGYRTSKVDRVCVNCKYRF